MRKVNKYASVYYAIVAIVCVLSSPAGAVPIGSFKFEPLTGFSVAQPGTKVFISAETQDGAKFGTETLAGQTGRFFNVEGLTSAEIAGLVSASFAADGFAVSGPSAATPNFFTITGTKNPD